MSFKIYILGDPIFTCEGGYNPYVYHVYDMDNRLYDNEIESVDDTWWKQVIDTVGRGSCA